MLKSLSIFLLSAACVSAADKVETRFLLPGDTIFKADFDDGKNPGKPNWMLRKSAWTANASVLRGVNVDGNGPFFRLHSKENGGVLKKDVRGIRTRASDLNRKGRLDYCQYLH